MASLMDKIREYGQHTGGLAMPIEESDRQLFENIFNPNRIDDYRPLDLAELRKFAAEIYADEVKSYERVYRHIAARFGIECVDSSEGEVTIPDVEISGNMDEVDTVEISERIQEESGNMQNNNEMMPIPRVGISKESLNDLRSIMRELAESISASKPKAKREKHKWSDNVVKNFTSFNDAIFGYNLEKCKEKLEIKKALLLTGVPGTGKSTIMRQLIHSLADGDTSKYIITSFAHDTKYSDFIGGIVAENGDWVYKDGVLTKMCQLADSDRDHKYYLGIDELSRGNTEAILGEALPALESRDTEIVMKNGDILVIPSNLYFVCAMNITDNSTKKIDAATKERFIEYRIEPQWGNKYVDWIVRGQDVTSDVLNTLNIVSDAMKEINKLIRKDTLLGEDKVIGTRSISNIKLTEENVKSTIKGNLLPQIKERIKHCGDSHDDLVEYVNIIIEQVK